MPEKIYLSVKGVGVDLIRINRVAGVYRRRPERFLKRIFTEKEISLLLKRNNPVSSIASRFAAKEAVSKALGCGIGAVQWRDIEILADARGKPEVYLQGEAARWAGSHGITGVLVSMSHDTPFALAEAIAYGNR